MQWNKGFTSTIYATYVDADTWKDGKRFEIESGSVALSDSELRGSADFASDQYSENTEKWIRLWLDAEQNGDIEHIALFTGLATSPAVTINGNVKDQKVSCYSVLKPVQDILLPRGWYVLAGTNGVTAIKNLLASTPAPIAPTGTAPMLKSNIIAENNESMLSMITKILNAIGWTMRVLGDGTIDLRPMPTKISAIFEPNDNDIVEPSLTITNDWFDAPNVYRAVMDDVSATARDTDANSSLSLQNRGREVWVEEDGVGLADNETLAQYARRKLKEAQAIETTATYTRRFDPNLNVSDIIQMRYDQISGTYRIIGQKFDLGIGQSVSEEVVKV